MKQFKLFVMTLIAILLAACSNGGKINPISKKINGPLGKFFEVVERDYKISDGELSVEFKRIAEGGPSDASWSTSPSFLVELQDEDGNVISTESTHVVNTEDQLESVFSLGVDETASITFKFDKTKGVVKFKISSKWDAENEEKTEPAESSIKAIHKAALINDPDGWTNVRSMPDAKAKIVAKIVDGEEFYFDEVPGSNWVKVYRSADAAAECIGYMFSRLVMPVGGSNGNELSLDSDDDDSDNNKVSSVGSEKWDALLKSYEEYVDKYISYLKKASKGDMTALSEYPALMQKAQEFSDKMKNAESEMSVSQWARYNKITMKMLEAAQEMQQ